MIAYDTEAVEIDSYKPGIPNRTSEHGFGWLRMADVIDIAPGAHGKNWHPFIKAKHWINQDFKNFQNKVYVVGNPWGFWEEFGEFEFYYPSQGSTPFNELFEDLAAGRSVRKVAPNMTAKALRGTNSGRRGRGGRGGRGDPSGRGDRGAPSGRIASSARDTASTRGAPFKRGAPTNRGAPMNINGTARASEAIPIRTNITVKATTAESMTSKESNSTKAYTSTSTKKNTSTNSVTIS